MNTNFQNLSLAVKQRSELDKSLDRGFIWLTRIFALAIAGILLWIALQVASSAWPAIQEFGLGFLVQSSWNPVNDNYGVLPAIYGTLMSSFIGLLLAVPIGVGTAVLLSENFLPSQVRLVLVFLVELLAAIPSVVYGVWGIFVLIPILNDVGKWLHSSLGWIPFFSSTPTGPGMLPAGVILAIMTLPIITAISRDALISLPPSLRQAALGLGATRWETIFQVLIPAAFSGIVSAVMLALGRAMGETMAVTMLIGNSNNINISLLAPSNTISSLLANQFSEASGLQVSALMYAALVLFLLTLLVNILAEFIVIRVKRL
ncbi:MAG: phosphate ABC transporter permease subunit PstC [Sphaerospermopsis kisseleviana]|jgi:phosphate transport system permease protein|uniref:Phosphate transport system permease protein n=2 Tax=Sphaerospermopsis TaxID=752201 RepID=A0ABR9VB88_9CYAN|nr:MULTISPECIES: phosphate ABC transporter permease subunit PstC [Sphaerospermopsis]BAZ80339.1 phosphate ABC transporter, permease protein PstC [Sphaerospermopsis kisseleviana NIES-73]MBD2131791.1 phosphate ABC transporter permease subunit PstC [Sphaerospermopsis sp. FACHB-1094]MBD2145982.1 phosphate ABC transporter permease subunit PstC [Sphaerospermopsis sp. FACHB-1194]MBE9235743.1 phosphate ABC transporter permease subunit PstC [Sphaerospermopsis aphanizomenoides LEGE 00250]MDB9444213.1 pho